MNEKMMFYSDVDGTMIDHETYSFKEAKQSLEEIINLDTPLVLVTSKTRREVDALKNQLKEDNLEFNHPFIFENGSAICIPKGYFNFDLKEIISDYPVEEEDNNYIIKISKANYQNMITILKEIEKDIKAKIIGFNDLSPEELSKECGLSVEQSKLAKKREFDEPFRIEPDNPELYKKAEEIIKQKGLNYTKGGRYAHIMGKHDKGLSVEILNKLYNRQFGKIKSIGIGDSKNDLEFLEFCDKGYLVNNPKKPLDASVESTKIHRVNKIGPVGFNEVVMKSLRKH